MDGIIKAKEYMESNNLKMVLYSNGKIVAESIDRGIKPIYDVYTKNFESLKGAFVADRITGKAAAMFLAQGKIAGIYTELISEPALEILQMNKIKIEYKQKVKRILNRDKTDMCPIEKIASGKDNVEDLIEGIEEFLISIGTLKRDN